MALHIKEWPTTLACVLHKAAWLCWLRRRIFLLPLLLCLGTSAGAASLIQERAWFEDDTGMLSWEQVKNETFTPFTGLLGKGFGTAPIWIRILVDPQSQEPAGDPQERLVLRIMPAHLDEIELFDPLGTSVSPRRTGDQFAWSDDEYPSRYFNFVILRGHEQRYVWLRLTSTRSRMIDVDVMSEEHIRRSDSKHELLSAAYFGALVLFVGWALNVYLNAPDKLLAFFVAKQISALFYAVFGLGYARVILDGWALPTTIDHLSNLMMLSYVFFGIVSQLKFAEALKPPAWTLRFFWGGILLFPVELILLALDRPMAAVALCASSVLYTAILGVVITLWARSSVFSMSGGNAEFPAKPLLVGAHVLILAAVITGVLPAVGWVVLPSVAIYLPMAHALIAGGFLMWILQVRSHRLLKRQAQTEAQLQSLQTTVSIERRYREEQQQLLAMLAHELKTPLLAIGMMMDRLRTAPDGTQRIKQALGEMNVIVNRCVQAGRMWDKPLVLHRTSCDALKLLKQIAGSHHSDVEIRCNGQPGLILDTDEQVLRMLLSNLMENACRYGDPAQGVDVSCETKVMGGRDGILFVFSNAEGPAGRPDPERVFSKYYRAPHARRQTGSGLGLYLVAGFAEQLGGSVRYVPDSTSIRFELWVPL